MEIYMCSDGLVEYPIKIQCVVETLKGKVFNLNKEPSFLSWKPRLRESCIDVTPLSGCLECGISIIFREFISILC